MLIMFFSHFQYQQTLQAENQRLKDENGALIRVISKLSKWAAPSVSYNSFIREVLTSRKLFTLLFQRFYSYISCYLLNVDGRHFKYAKSIFPSTPGDFT